MINYFSENRSSDDSDVNTDKLCIGSTREVSS